MSAPESVDRPIAAPGEPLRWLRSTLGAAQQENCIDWPYACTPKGYGLIHLDGVLRSVTHVVLELTGHPRPPSPRDRALHSCDRPVCVNPGHLRWGTESDNRRDMWERERRTGNGLQGEQTGSAVLTEAQVRAIREARAEGAGERELASRYGVHRDTIGRIIRRQTWGHVE